MHTATEAVKYVKEKLQTRQEEKRETVHANAKKKLILPQPVSLLKSSFLGFLHNDQ